MRSCARPTPPWSRCRCARVAAPCAPLTRHTHPLPVTCLTRVLQLLGVNMPAAFDQARVEQETAVQGIEQAKEQKEVAVINANTRVSLAREEAQVIVLEAEAKAASLRLQASAQVEALRARFKAEREVSCAAGRRREAAWR